MFKISFKHSNVKLGKMFSFKIFSSNIVFIDFKNLKQMHGIHNHTSKCTNTVRKGVKLGFTWVIVLFIQIVIITIKITVTIMIMHCRIINIKMQWQNKIRFINFHCFDVYHALQQPRGKNCPMGFELFRPSWLGLGRVPISLVSYLFIAFAFSSFFSMAQQNKITPFK